MLCQVCRGKCHEPPTPAEPIEIECSICAGAGCEACNDGHWQLTQCPRHQIGATVIQAAKLSRHVSNGSWPRAGGILDQTAWFVHFVEAMQADIARIDDERWRARYGR